MDTINHSLAVVEIHPPSPQMLGRVLAWGVAVPHLKLHHVSWLYDEFPGGEGIVGLVLLLTGPVEVEGRIAAEPCRSHCVRVKTPVFFMRGPLCQGKWKQSGVLFA